MRRRTRAAFAAVVAPFLSATLVASVADAPMAGAQTVNGSAAGLAGAESGDRAVQARLTKAIAAAVQNRANDVSVTVHDRRTDTYVHHNASLRNVTGSIVKVMVLVAFVQDRREAGRALTSYDRSLARRMITTSDNDATTTLFNAVGGKSRLQRLASSRGMKDTRASSAWGLTTTSAADQGRLIDDIVDGDAFSDPDDQAYVLDLMGKVVPEQAWGVGAIPASADVALKNGWISREPRAWRINSVGHVTAANRDYTLTMLSYDSASMDDGVALLNRVSRAVYDTLGVKTARSLSSAGGDQAATFSLPEGAPRWLLRPGAAFPPYPAW